MEEVRGDLEERFPQWSSRIRLLHFEENPAARPVDNDGRCIFYNEQAMKGMTRLSRCFYMAQQLMHIQLAHGTRREGRDRRLWKRATDAVVNSMLRDEGFQLPPESFEILPDSTGPNLVCGRNWHLHWREVDGHMMCIASESMNETPEPIPLSRKELLQA